jgi:hypothetical protein
MDETVGFVGRDAELGKALDALGRGNNLLVKDKAGIGKSAFLRQFYERRPRQLPGKNYLCRHPGRMPGSSAMDGRPRLAGCFAGTLFRGNFPKDRPCPWAGDCNAKALLFELIEQTHRRVGLAVPERLLSPRIQVNARREGRVRWQWVVKPLERATTKGLAAILVESLRDRGALVFIESLEVAPALAELFADLTETCQIAAAMDAKNRRVRCVLPGNVRYRFATLTRAELSLLIIMGLAGVLLMPLARTGEGTTGLIRSALGRLAEACEIYDERT